MMGGGQERLGTWLEVAALAAVLGALIAAMDRVLLRPVPETWLRVVLALVAVEAALIAAAVSTAVARKLWHRARARRRARIEPLVQRALAAYLAGDGDLLPARALFRRDRAVVEECLCAVLRAVTGEAQAAAVRLVVGLDLLPRWRAAVRARRRRRRQAAIARLALLPAELRNDVVVGALADADEGVRRAAVRALVPTADVAGVGEAIRTIATRSLTERALLVDELRRHAHRLAPQVFAPALASPDAAVVVAALEMVRACGRVLPVPLVATLLADARDAVRAAAVRTVPAVVGAAALAAALMERLDDPALAVRVATTEVLGQLHVHEALAHIARGLRAEDPRLAVASAHALAALGTAGHRRLQAALLHGDGVAPLAAAEALGRALVGRGTGVAA